MYTNIKSLVYIAETNILYVNHNIIKIYILTDLNSSFLYHLLGITLKLNEITRFN